MRVGLFNAFVCFACGCGMMLYGLCLVRSFCVLLCGIVCLCGLLVSYWLMLYSTFGGCCLCLSVRVCEFAV